ncbi:MAG TPA: hypothetical protein VNY05_40415 [Candidatus Acidoferrales bacterium]|nr:hypothetical protein [Candidatus Acidoferrales bacterium]
MRSRICSIICGIALPAAIGAAYAQTDSASIIKALHDLEDQQWARKSGLTVSDVRALRLLAGMTDATWGAAILNIDAISLKSRNHILFAEAGGHCMRLHILERSATGVAEIWSLNEIPGPIWPHGKMANRPGLGICSPAPKAPNAYVTPDGRIALEVPMLTDPFLRTLPVSTYLFTWNGSKYELVDDDR